jgi:hypothetical protein
MVQKRSAGRGRGLATSNLFLRTFVNVERRWLPAFPVEVCCDGPSVVTELVDERAIVVHRIHLVFALARFDTGDPQYIERTKLLHLRVADGVKAGGTVTARNSEDQLVLFDLNGLRV